MGSLPVPIWNSTPTYSYLCQHPYLLLCRCTPMSSTVVVCVNPRRRRWCRDGIPDPGNAVQIPSLPSCHQPQLCCRSIAGESEVQCNCWLRSCRCTRQQCLTCSPIQALHLQQNKFLSKASLSINSHRSFHLYLDIFRSVCQYWFQVHEVHRKTLVDLVVYVDYLVHHVNYIVVKF